MVRHFCSYFDRFYLPRALAMWHSLMDCLAGPAEWWALCLDETAYAAMREINLPGVHVLSLQEIEDATPGLASCRNDRSLVEYYFTLSPFLPLHVLEVSADVSMVTYLDADLFFYASPEPLFEELGGASVGLIEHRFAESRRDHCRYGLFNVGWVTFRNDAAGREALTWWSKLCLDHCRDVADQGRFADQKYLDDWPERFASVHVLTHPGANVAPWNLARHDLTWNETSQSVEVDGRHLLFFHFHDLQVHWNHLWEMPGRYWGVRSVRFLKRRIYRPYVEAWVRAMEEIPQSAESQSARPAAERGNEALRQGNVGRRLFRIAKLALQNRLIWR